MDLDLEREALRRSYRLCWVGFSFLALALIVASVCSIGSLLLLFSGHRPDIGRILGIDRFEFLVDTLRAGTRIIGAFFLWSAWTEPGWRRRAGLLVMMATADVVLWGAEYGIPLGLTSEPLGHEVFRHSLSMALGWAKFGLIASLAADFATHLGATQEADFGKAARATATTGASVWFFYFLNRINWGHPWPLVERPWTRDMLLFLLATWVISAICLVQTSLMTMLASRGASQALRDMTKEDQRFNPWTSPADPGRERR